MTELQHSKIMTPSADDIEQFRRNQITIDRDPDDLWDDSRMIVNIGPTHPAMHGALRMIAKLNGETIAAGAWL